MGSNPHLHPTTSQKNTANLSCHQPSVPHALTMCSQISWAIPTANPNLPLKLVLSDSNSGYKMSTQSQVDPDVASVEQCNQMKPPMLTGGKVSTQVLWDFSDSCKSYFLHKEIAADKQVTAIIMGIKDHCIEDWYCALRSGGRGLFFIACEGVSLLLTLPLFVLCLAIYGLISHCPPSL